MWWWYMFNSSFNIVLKYSISLGNSVEDISLCLLTRILYIYGIIVDAIKCLYMVLEVYKTPVCWEKLHHSVFGSGCL